MPTISPGTPQYSFADAIGKAMSDVFSQALSSSWKVALGPEQASQKPDASRLRFPILLSGALEGNALLQVRGTDALLLAQIFLGEPAEPSAELNADRKDALEELLRQVVGCAETAFKSIFGELKAQLAHAGDDDSPGVTLSLTASEASCGMLPMELRMSSQLLTSLDAAARSVDEVPAEQSGALLQPDDNLKLLLGVHLNLTLRFGQRVLTLREILDLTSGSVVELDRQVQEPVDLLLGDRLIARGEVVIVDGNYGIRVTEVEDPRQRIQRI